MRKKKPRERKFVVKSVDRLTSSNKKHDIVVIDNT